ncbi:MAG: DUF4325 domain-containing protein [Patescibacteria group bacterium]
MKLQLKKFGTTLSSRQAGLEAYNAIHPSLNHLSVEETIEVDFDGVITFSPSWADEFLTRLKKEYEGRVLLLRSDNPSVKATLDLLEEIYGKDT